MENQNQPASNPQQPYYQQPMQQAVPNATGALVLGIISIPTCICYGIIGMVCGIIAIVLAGKAKKIFDQSPNMYTASSMNNARAGKICGIIGLILSALFLVYLVVYIVIVGTLATSIFSSFPWEEIK